MRRSVAKGILTSVLVAGVLVGLWLVFVVPHPSFRRTAVVLNASTNEVGVECVTSDAKHRLQIWLAPGGSSEFVYFAGDRGGAEGGNIGARILVTNVDTGQQAERNLRLSIEPSRPVIQISNDWFDASGTAIGRK